MLDERQAGQPLEDLVPSDRSSTAATSASVVAHAVEAAKNRTDRQRRRHQPGDAEARDAGAESPSEVGVRSQIERRDAAGGNGRDIDEPQPAVQAHRAGADPEPQLHRTGQERDPAGRDVQQQPRALRFVARQNRRIEQKIGKRDADEESERDERRERNRRQAPAGSSRS